MESRLLGATVELPTLPTVSSVGKIVDYLQRRTEIVSFFIHYFTRGKTVENNQISMEYVFLEQYQNHGE